MKAASEIEVHVTEKGLSEADIARIIYPKTKGQRGGDDLEEDVIDQIDTMLPRETANPKHLKSLTDLSLYTALGSPKKDGDTFGPGSADDLYG